MPWELSENLFWEPGLHTHLLIYPQACLSQTVVQSPLFVGGLHPSHHGREESTANSTQVKTLCPWKQLEGKLFPVLLFIPWKCLPWEREAQSPAMEARQLTGAPLSVSAEGSEYPIRMMFCVLLCVLLLRSLAVGTFCSARDSQRCLPCDVSAGGSVSSWSDEVTFLWLFFLVL